MKKTYKKLGYFVVKAIWPRAVPLCRNIFYKSPLGALKAFWGADLDCYGTVRNKKSHNETNEKGTGESDHTPGPSAVGVQWCPPPISCLTPGCCIHPVLYLKNVAPLWFLSPLLRNPGDGLATLPLHIY